MEQLLLHIARALVDEPDKIEVSLVEGEHSLVLELRVAPGDMGKVIGRQGRIAKAIRTLVSAAALKDNRRVMVEIIQ